MAKIELIMPKMGESIMEATIIKWTKSVGDQVELDETILEIATDKVDSDIPSPVAGVITEILFQEDDVVEVGKAIAIISTEGEEVKPSPAVAEAPSAPKEQTKTAAPKQATVVSSSASSSNGTNTINDLVEARPSQSGRFYSPLVRSIAKQESISVNELDAIPGSGLNNRVTKADILAYLNTRSHAPSTSQPISPAPQKSVASSMSSASASPAAVSLGGGTEIIEMDRMRKMIADHMVMSKKTSPHVTSFVEVDVTNIVNWRNNIKVKFQEQYGQKITFTPIFMEAVIKAIHDFPMINVSLDGTKIIKKNYINIGMATALPSGNLIVPVIKNADNLNLIGLTKSVNELANRARNNKLKPDDIQDGTFTLTNVGTFGNVLGTPIINQPQVAIMAIGAIRKKPAVVETEYGDLIAIRHMMYLSLSYDHRVVDGFLGGSFLRKAGDYMEAFDPNRSL